MLHSIMDTDQNGIIDGKENPSLMDDDQFVDEFQSLSLGDLKALWQINKVRAWSTVRLSRVSL